MLRSLADELGLADGWPHAVTMTGLGDFIAAEAAPAIAVAWLPADELGAACG